MKKRILLLPLLCGMLTACSEKENTTTIPQTEATESIAASSASITGAETEAAETIRLDISIPETDKEIFETSEVIESSKENQTPEPTTEPTELSQEARETVPADYVISNDVKHLVHSLLDQKAAGSDSASLLTYYDQIRQFDSIQADIWKDIVDFWDITLQDGYINQNILPDGLPNDNSMCIVVLGYHLNDDGTMRPELIGRVQTALDCANKYPNSYVLVSGGGTALANPGATEADAMAEWLVANGLDPARLIVEKRSLSSSENAVLSYEILKNNYPQISSVAIVTSDYHVALGCQLFYEQFKMAEMLHGDKAILIISNAAYISNSSSFFSLSGQAGWMMDLFYYQK